VGVGELPVALEWHGT